jgi:hypothetical protein
MALPSASAGTPALAANPGRLLTPRAYRMIASAR